MYKYWSYGRYIRNCWSCYCDCKTCTPSISMGNFGNNISIHLFSRQNTLTFRCRICKYFITKYICDCNKNDYLLQHKCFYVLLSFYIVCVSLLFALILCIWIMVVDNAILLGILGLFFILGKFRYGIMIKWNMYIFLFVSLNFSGSLLCLDCDFLLESVWKLLFSLNFYKSAQQYYLLNTCIQIC